ncbi:MAG: FAD-dependent oxidoreductase [Jiangellaceae bacterium]
MDVVVVGAGVIGLSVALRLQAADLVVRIVARELPFDTTSGVAAAIWYPYRAYPEAEVLRWGRHTFAVFEQMAATPSAGVRMGATRELFRDMVPDPWWRAAVPDLRRCRPAELPDGYRDGYAFTTPVVEMPVYLDGLWQRFESAGGVIEQRAVESLADAAGAARVVVNCAGLGARELAGDTSVTPIRGQIVRVENPGLDQVVLDEGGEHVTYIVPRTGDCVLGGTAEEGETGLEPDPRTATAILNRCTALEPRLHGARVLGHRVGLRPGRPAVRLDREDLVDGTPCVHCYGHGGAGVTLSWGCADDVVALVRVALS